MEGEFRNFERLRYRLSVDMENITSNNKKTEERQKNQISNTIFATIFSALINNVAFADLSMVSSATSATTSNVSGTLNQIENILIQALAFCFVFILAYLLYDHISPFVPKLIGELKVKSTDKSDANMKKIKKDFDNIACDCILVAQEYRQSYEATILSQFHSETYKQTMLQFYYFEVLHYIAKASQKIKILMNNKDQCIRTENVADGVDLFRVKNTYELIKDTEKEFLNKNIDLICKDNEQEKDIRYQLLQVNNISREIEESLNKYE
ncbi:MAG: hypothetical protein LUI87_03460 [Lachnospiraceae bacterium]|nr:hypothetical protein [Lachnospiraceae bacterium]